MYWEVKKKKKKRKAKSNCPAVQIEHLDPKNSLAIYYISLHGSQHKMIHHKYLSYISNKKDIDSRCLMVLGINWCKQGHIVHNSSNSVLSSVCGAVVLWSKYSSSIVSLRMNNLCMTTGWVIFLASLMSVSSLWRVYASSIILIHLCSSFGVLFNKEKEAIWKMSCHYNPMAFNLKKGTIFLTCIKHGDPWLRVHFLERKLLLMQRTALPDLWCLEDAWATLSLSVPCS